MGEIFLLLSLPSEDARKLRLTSNRRIKPVESLRPPPRLKLWRERRNLTQEKLAELAQQSQSKIARVERGDQALDMEDAELFASILDTGPTDLFVQGPETVPVRFRIGETKSGRPELPKPHARLPVPSGIVKVEFSFAVELADRSADLLYPIGTRAIVVERDAAGPLRPGDPVAVGIRDASGWAKIYLGELSPTALGDVLVSLRTNVLDLPATIAVRRARVTFLGATDRPALYLPETVDVTPRATDEAEILGRVECVIAPANASAARDLAA